jgi:hypothetical protein
LTGERIVVDKRGRGGGVSSSDEFSLDGWDDQKPLSLSPLDFEAVFDTERSQLLDLTCEQVLELKAKEEMQRTEHMARDEDCEARVFFRCAPAGLLVALRILSDHKARGKFLVMKCLAHHGLALLSTLEGVREANKQYRNMLILNGKYGGLTDLIEQIDIQQYRHKSATEQRGELRAARELLSAYSAYAKGLSINASALLAECLAWSLTTSDDSALVGMMNELRPGVDHFKRYINERIILLQAYWEISQLRVNGRHG